MSPPARVSAICVSAEPFGSATGRCCPSGGGSLRGRIGAFGRWHGASRLLVGLTVVGLAIRGAVLLTRLGGGRGGLLRRGRRVLRSGPGELGRHAFQALEDLVAARLEVGDHGLDVLLSLVRLVDDPLRLLARLGERLLGVAVGVRAGLGRVLVRVGPQLLRCRLGHSLRLGEDLVGLGPRLGGLRLRTFPETLNLSFGLDAQPLGHVVRLGEDLRRLLANLFELAPPGAGGSLVRHSRLEPFGQSGKESVDLVLVVTAPTGGERRGTNAVDAFLIHASSCRCRQGANAATNGRLEPATIDRARWGPAPPPSSRKNPCPTYDRNTRRPPSSSALGARRIGALGTRRT